MDGVTINKNEEIVIKLLHYFIVEEGYSPVILRGAKDEIWLENSNGPYKIVRIVSNYIHNDEQFAFDLYRTKQIMKKIKQKTFSFNMNALSLFVNLGDNVHSLDEQNQFDHITAIKLNDIVDLANYNFVTKDFPNITKDTEFKESGVELFVKLTSDINKKNKDESLQAEDVFKIKPPIITYILIALNCLIFLALFFYDPSLSGNTLYKFGAITNDCIKNGEIYRFMTCIFLHAGFVHLFCNMYSLYILGPQIESFYGKWKYLCIYLGSGITGALLSSLFLKDNVVSLGASGAIFGLLGSLLYFGYHYRVYLGGVIKTEIIPLILLNLIFGCLIAGVDVTAHIGGLIGGILFAMACGVKYKSTTTDKVNGWIMTAIFLAFLVFLAR